MIQCAGILGTNESNSLQDHIHIPAVQYKAFLNFWICSIIIAFYFPHSLSRATENPCSWSLNKTKESVRGKGLCVKEFVILFWKMLGWAKGCKVIWTFGIALVRVEKGPSREGFGGGESLDAIECDARHKSPIPLNPRRFVSLNPVIPQLSHQQLSLYSLHSTLPSSLILPSNLHLT